MFSRALSLYAGLFLLVACREKADDNPRPAPTAPWAAPAPTASNGSTEQALTSRFRIEPSSLVRVRLPAKDAQPSGVFRNTAGTLDVDLRDLTNTRGSIEIDLGSIVMQDDAVDSGGDGTSRAKNWMNLGTSRPEAEVARLRAARFTLTQLTATTAPAAHLGRRVPLPADSEARASERRRVSLTAVGQLEVNGRRTAREARLDVDFDYASAAAEGATPTRITVHTARPIPVPLTEHAIEPRDAQGRLVAADLDLVGRVVGAVAQIEVQLVATPSDGSLAR